jgi:hypothetical protein
MASGWKRWMAAGLLAGMLVAVPSVRAQGRRNNNRCAQRVRQAENHLQQAIRKHGPRSKQAREKRRQLENARERCGGL